MSLKRDPICGMSGAIELDGYGFCSEGCVAEYRRRQALAQQPGMCAVDAKRAWHRDPLLWVLASAAAALFAGSAVGAAQAFSERYRAYIITMGGPLILGLVLGGFIDYAIPKNYIIKVLARPRKRSVIYATLLGFLASACSHGCLALSLELYRKGAATSSVVSFLLASPWASFSLMMILLSLFGLPGFVIVAAALLVAIVTGLIFQRLANRGLIESNPHTADLPEGFSIRRDLRERLRGRKWSLRQLGIDLRGVAEGSIPLARMTLLWVQIGLILSALMDALVPHHLFEQWFGPSPLGLLFTLLLATVMEVCSEGTAPVAFELYRHTGALGNAFVFLMGGVVTDYTELGALWVNVGRRTVGWLLLVAVPLVFLIGLVLNLVF